jgi:Glucuronate isomerase
MKSLITENFLLTNETAIKLYHDYAKDMPIIDYHCHLDPKAIAEDKRFENIADIWLGGDHYKWRVMRALGVDESYITGDKSPEEKFQKWAESLPYALGNPLVLWSDLELVRYFEATESLNKANWRAIYDKCNEVINTKEFSVQSLITNSNVKWICTTDDPIDTLEYHQQIAAQKDFKTTVTPAFRPDNVLRIEFPSFVEYVGKLGTVVGVKISTFSELVSALHKRIEYFNANGAFISDHAFATICYAESTDDEVNTIFQKRLTGSELTQTEIDKFVTKLFIKLAEKYAELNWAMQLHIGAMRNVDAALFEKLGPDTGNDGIGNSIYADNLGKLLSALNNTDSLPKTILYDLNAANNDILATLAGCFQGEAIRAKIQLGTPWWFNDQKTGMINQLTSLANMGVLGTFIGMLTDSRSFLSYTRHEYFRRILCNLIGTWSENGEVTDDIQFLGEIVQDIAYNNAYKYFNLDANPFNKK